MSYRESWVPFGRDAKSGMRFHLVNTGFADAGIVPDATRPHVAAIRFTFQNPEPGGVGDENEVNAIEEAMDALEPSLRDECSALFVGRIRGGGRSDFFFYMPSAELATFEAAAKGGLTSFRVDIVSQSDPKWKTYLAMLPTPAEMRVFQDSLVVNQLQENGDPLTPKRDVGHFLYFPASKQAEAEACAKVLKGEGFKVSVEPAEGSDQIAVRANRDDSVTLEAISPITRRMVELSEQFGGEYDGWEAMFVKPKGMFGKLFGR